MPDPGSRSASRVPVPLPTPPARGTCPRDNTRETRGDRHGSGIFKTGERALHGSIGRCSHGADDPALWTVPDRTKGDDITVDFGDAAGNLCGQCHQGRNLADRVAGGVVPVIDGPDVEVIEPAALRNEVGSVLHDALARYRDGDPVKR